LPEISDPHEIENKSFEIIEGLLAGMDLFGPQKAVVMRVVHATADTDFASAMVFSEGSVEAGISAIRAGCKVITDVNMLKAGISSLDRAGRVSCRISDPVTAALAKESKTTRAATAMRLLAGDMKGAIVAVSNAPTALYEVMRLVREEGVRPALIVGVPVGFVGASESKEELLGLLEVPFITCRGRKGGSPVGAAIVNALIKLAG